MAKQPEEQPTELEEMVTIVLHDPSEPTGRKELRIPLEQFRSVTVPLDDGQLFVSAPRKLWWLGDRRSISISVFSGMRHMAHFAPSAGNTMEVASIVSGWEPKDEEVGDAG